MKGVIPACRARLPGVGLLTLAATVAASGVTAGAGARSPVATVARKPPIASSVFAATALTRTGAILMTLRSASTGKVVKVIARLDGKTEQLSTEFGFALSSDARYVYCTSTAPRGRYSTVDVVQIDVATGRRRFIAFGAEPAVSPNGRLLAYVAETHGYLEAIAVRDVRTGRTAFISLAPLIGGGKNLLNAAVGWFANGSDIAVIPADDAPSTVGGPNLPSRRTSGSCPPGSVTTCLIIVHRTDPKRALSARPFAVAVPDNTYAAQDALSPDASSPSSVLLAASGWHDQQAIGPLIIDQLTPARGQVTTRRLVSLPASAAMTFNPNGTRLLYVHGSLLEPWLWEAEIVGRHLRHARILSRRSQLGASAAW